MSWDPKTALVVYRPLDFYSVAEKEASRTIDETKVALSNKEEELDAYRPTLVSSYQGRDYKLFGNDRGMSFSQRCETIDKINLLVESVNLMEGTFTRMIRGFEVKFLEDFLSVDIRICKLKSSALRFAKRHIEILEEVTTVRKHSCAVQPTA